MNDNVEVSKNLGFVISNPGINDDFFHLILNNQHGFLKTKVNRKAFRTFVHALRTWDGKSLLTQVGPDGERYRMSNERILSGQNKKKHFSIQKGDHFMMLMCPNKEVFKNLSDYLIKVCALKRIHDLYYC